MSTGELSDYYDNLIGRDINNCYRIEMKLGEGGMGAVFRAIDLRTEEKVAIKVIAPDIASDKIFIKRFKREARVGGLLSHNNIIKVLEYGQTSEGLFFMVMEYIEGETLSNYLNRQRRLPLTRILEIFQQLCNGLAAAHERGIVHRDLKPANILISNQHGTETVKLADFGIMKLVQSDKEITEGGAQLTAMGEIFGTPNYMSPEQIMAGIVGKTGDIYSLGVILYEMLTGYLPFNTSNMKELRMLKTLQLPPPPSTICNSVPVDCDAVLLKALARDKDERYQTIDSFYQDFARVLARHSQAATAARRGVNAFDSNAPTIKVEAVVEDSSQQPTLIRGTAVATEVSGAAAVNSVRQQSAQHKDELALPVALPAPGTNIKKVSIIAGILALLFFLLFFLIR